MKNIEIAVGAIIKKGDSILLVKRKKKHFLKYWSLPVGKLEYGEKAINGIKREIMEELGLTFIPKFCCYNDSINVLHNRHFVVLYFVGLARGKLELNTEELREAQWFTLKDVLKMKLGFEHKIALEKYNMAKK
ncbi:MAG: NUDIX hydrolase [Patescibacteria group bacterium]